MAKIKIYGSCDDLVEVVGCDGADEFTASDAKPDQVCWEADLIGPGGTDALHVWAVYRDTSTWSVAAGHIDDGVPMPNWPIQIVDGAADDDTPSYSTVLLIDAPDGTRIDNVKPGR